MWYRRTADSITDMIFLLPFIFMSNFYGRENYQKRNLSLHDPQIVFIIYFYFVSCWKSSNLEFYLNLHTKLVINKRKKKWLP